jgi:hypothetical protein
VIAFVGGLLVVLGLAQNFMPTPDENSVSCTTPIPTPKTGIFADFSTSHPARLTVRTRQGADYLIKLVNARSNLTEMMFYVAGGRTIHELVPGGTFVFKYATGNRWCNDVDLFGRDTQINQAVEEFTFTDETHWTVELIKQTGGNLRMHSIPRQQF